MVDVSNSDANRLANVKTHKYLKIQNGSKLPFQKPLIIILTKKITKIM